MNIRSLLILLCAGFFATLLGEQVDAAKSIQEETRRANNGSPSGLALEISGDGKVRFHEVPGAGASHLVSQAPMVSTYKGKDAQLGFWYGLEGEAVRVTIALSYPGSGLRIKTSDPEQNVRGLQQTNSAQNVSYLLQPGQKIDVDYFSEYGVKAFEIKIVTVKHVAPPLPSFSSCTDAIQLVSVERVEGEFPSYKFTLRNVGSRRISVLHGETETRIGLSTAGEHPVAEPGQQFTITVTSGYEGRLTRDAYRPDTFASFKVTSVVFGDDDFAGDRIQALYTLQGLICIRLTLNVVIELLNGRIESGNTDLGELRSKVLAVFQDAGVDEMRQLIARFPESAHRLKRVSCSLYSDSIEKRLLRRIDAFERDHSQSATKEQTIDFLKSLRESYLRALSRWKARS